MKRLCSIVLLCVGLAACSPLASPTPAQQGETNRIQLVKETQLTEEGWEIRSWSPDGSRLLVLKQNAGTGLENVPIAIVNLEDDSIAKISHPGVGAIWSPDSAALVIESIGEHGKRERWLFSLQENQATRLDGIAGGPIAWLAGGRLVYDAEDGLWSVKLDLPKGSATSSPLAVSEPTHVLSYAHAGGRRWSFPSPQLTSIMLYDGVNDQDVKWWLVQPNGDWIRVDKLLYSLGTCCAWSPDGSRFAFLGFEPGTGPDSSAYSGPGLYVVDANGENLKRILTAQDVGAGTFISMSFSPDGQTIAFEWSRHEEGFPFGNTQIYVVNVDGSGLRNLTPNSAPHRWLRWSPNGKYIAFEQNDSVWVAEVTNRQ